MSDPHRCHPQQISQVGISRWSPAGLQGMYNRVLQFIPQQCQILIDVTHSKSHRLVSVGHITHSKSHRLVSVGRVPLQGMYDRVLQFIPQQCQILIDVTHSKSHRLVSVGQRLYCLKKKISMCNCVKIWIYSCNKHDNVNAMSSSS